MAYYKPLDPLDDEFTEFIPRLVPKAPPAVAIDDPGTSVCIRIAAPWVKHLAGYLIGLTRFDAWDGTEAEILFAVNEVTRLLGLLRQGSGDCTGGGASVAYTLQLNGCNVELLADGVVQDSLDLSALDCLANYTENNTFAYAIANVNNLTYQEMVNTYQAVYDQYFITGETAVNPDSTANFVNPVTDEGFYIFAAAMYITWVTWRDTFVTQVLAEFMAEYEKYLVAVSARVVASRFGSARGLQRILNSVDTPAPNADTYQALTDQEAVRDVLDNAIVYLGGRPENYTEWASASNYNAFLDSTSLALDAVADDFFWNNEGNFISYLAIKRLAKLTIQAGDPLYSPRKYSNALLNGNWTMRRDAANQYFGVELLQAVIDGSNRISYVTVGSLAVIQWVIKFDRTVKLTSVTSSIGWTGTPGNVGNVLRELRTYDQGVQTSIQTYTGASSTQFPTFSGSVTAPVLADELAFYMQQNDSSVTTQFVNNIKITGIDLPPTNMFSVRQDQTIIPDEPF